MLPRKDECLEPGDYCLHGGVVRKVNFVHEKSHFLGGMRLLVLRYTNPFIDNVLLFIAAVLCRSLL